MGLAPWALVLWPWVLGSGLHAAAASPPLRVTFHHIHVNDQRAGHLAGYYGRLFDSATTKPAAIGDARGIEADGVFLLITPVREEPAESGGAGWHFGWGRVSLDEPYDRHRMQEIDLKLPMESFAKDLHVHLESEDPLRAAWWYRDRFSARVKTDARNAEVLPANAYLRRPAAIVELPGIVFAIYKSVDALGSSRGRRIDHLAFKADLRDAREAGFTVLEGSGRLGPFETMTIEGPDRLAIELVGAPALDRPATGASPHAIDPGSARASCEGRRGHQGMNGPQSAIRDPQSADGGSRTADRGSRSRTSL